MPFRVASIGARRPRRAPQYPMTAETERAKDRSETGFSERRGFSLLQCAGRSKASSRNPPSPTGEEMKATMDNRMSRRQFLGTAAMAGAALTGIGNALAA